MLQDARCENVNPCQVRQSSTEVATFGYRGWGSIGMKELHWHVWVVKYSTAASVRREARHPYACWPDTAAELTCTALQC
eukprot:scaffold78300_cov22-Tisochrysis_lutea.AAC.1